MTAPLPREPVVWRSLAALSAVRLAVYLLSAGPLAYDYMSDELYYLECARRLAWGYVDHPPLAPALLRLVDQTLGDSLLAVQLLPALAHCAAIVVVALLARELGGGRTAQRLAALATGVAPVYLGVTGFYSMNGFEPALWGGAALVLARIGNGADARAWLGLGVLLGLGLLNKISMLWLGFGLAVGLVATPERRWLRTPWPWLAAAIAGALFAPYVLWQVQHAWPVLEFMQNARAYKMVEKTPFAFAAEQLLLMHPLILPFWLAGLVHYFATPEGRRHQLLAWIWIATFALLATSGSARSNYLGPAYTVLLPAGGVAFERLARRRRWRWLPATAATLFVAGGAIGVPLALPLLPPDRYPSYERALGIRAPVEQVDELGAMPLHFALRFGWPELRAALHQALATLALPERAEAVVLGRWFGDTAVINAYREREGFPPAISGHNNYWIWGPGEARGEIVLAVAEDDVQLRTWFADVRRVAEVDCTLCMPNVDRLAIYACRKPLRPIREWWPEAKRFI